MAGRTPVVVFVMMLTAASVNAWEIEPMTTPGDKTLVKRASFLSQLPTRLGEIANRHVGQPMHEAFVMRAKDCGYDDPSECYRRRGKTAREVEALLAGIQWNDNPPFVLAKSGFTYADGKKAPEDCLDDSIRLPRHPVCWGRAILDAEKVAANRRIDATFPILYRSHYGDLQFLHAMSYADDTAGETLRKMMIWAEFAYKVAHGDIPATTPLDKVPVEGFPALIGIRDRPVDLLFTLGDPTFRRDRSIRWFALGTLLHMVQDTFSDSHVERGEEGGLCAASTEFRQPGLIQHFHSYDRQDGGKHKEADSSEPFINQEIKIGANGIDATRNILTLYQTGADWTRVRDYLTCVLAVPADARQARGDSGIGYEKETRTPRTPMAPWEQMSGAGG